MPLIIDRSCAKRVANVGVLVITALHASASQTIAGVVSWDTDFSGLWSESASWSTGLLPGAGDDVIISRAGANPIVSLLNETREARSLTLTNRFRLASSSSFLLHTDAMLDGQVIIQQSSHMEIIGNATIHDIVELSSTSSLTLGTMSTISGELELRGNSTATLGASSLVTGIIDVSAASLANNGTASVDGQISVGNGILSGGVYNVNAGGTISIENGAQIENLTINNNGIFSVDDFSVLDNVTIAGDWQYSRMRVRDGLTLGGTASATGNNAEIVFESGSTSLSGGTLEMIGSGIPEIILESGADVTIESDTSIRTGFASFGNDGFSPDPTTITNNGTISSVVAGGSLTIDPNTLINNGTIEAINGSAVRIGSNGVGDVWSSPGTLRVVDSSLVLMGHYDLSGVTWDRSGGEIQLNGTLLNSGNVFNVDSTSGSLILDGDVEGGIVNFLDGESFIFENATLRDTTINGDFTAPGFGIQNNVDINGTATIDDKAGGIFVGTDSTLGGSGEIVFVPGAGPVADRVISILNESTLTIGSDMTVSGGGFRIGDNIGGLNGLVNNGTIVSNQSGEQVIIGVEAFTNNGTLRVTDGEFLVGGGLAGNQFESSSVNSGDIFVEGGLFEIRGTFEQIGGNISITGGNVLLAGDLINTNSTLTLDGPNALWVVGDGGTIVGGQVVQLNRGRLDGTGGTLDGVGLVGDLDIESQGGTVRLINGTSVSGDVNISANSAAVAFPGTQSIDNITFNLDPAFNDTTIDIEQSLTLGPNVIVQGAGGGFGRIGFTGDLLINQGLVSANAPGAPLFTFSGGETINQGVMEAINGGTLRLDGQWANQGTLRVNSGTILLGGQFGSGDIGTIDRAGPGDVVLTGFLQNTGETWSVDDDLGEIILDGGTVFGGTLDLDDPSLLSFTTNTESAFQNLSINGSIELDGPSERVTVLGNLDLTGDAILSGSGSRIVYGSNGSLGSGSIVFDGGTGSQRLLALATLPSGLGTDLTISEGVMIRGGNGRIGVPANQLGPSATITNEGHIRADINDQTIEIAANEFVNNGTIEAAGGGAIDFVARTFGGALGAAASSVTNNSIFSITGDTSLGVEGSLVNAASGALFIEIGGGETNTLDVQSILSLEGGLLDIDYNGGLDPDATHSITVASASSITGQFDLARLPGTESGFIFDLAYSPTSINVLLTPFVPEFGPVAFEIGLPTGNGIPGSLEYFGLRQEFPLVQVPAPASAAIVVLLPVAMIRRTRAPI